MCVAVQTAQAIAGENSGYPMNQPASLRPATGAHQPDGKPCKEGASAAVPTQAQHTQSAATGATTDVARQDWDTLFRAVIARLLETAAGPPHEGLGKGEDRAESTVDSSVSTHIKECVQSLEQLRRTAGHTHLLGADPRD